MREIYVGRRTGRRVPSSCVRVCVRIPSSGVRVVYEYLSSTVRVVYKYLSSTGRVHVEYWFVGGEQLMRVRFVRIRKSGVKAYY